MMDEHDREPVPARTLDVAADALRLGRAVIGHPSPDPWTELPVLVKELWRNDARFMLRALRRAGLIAYKTPKKTPKVPK